MAKDITILAAARARRATWISLCALVVAIIAIIIVLIICPCPPPARTDSGPSSSLVRFKNESGQVVKVGMRARVSSNPDGSEPPPPSDLGPPFDPIPPGNDPGAFMSGAAMPADPGYRMMAFTPPPYIASYVFDFELEDGTKFVDVVCGGKPPEPGMHVYEVQVHIQSRVDDESGLTVYWIEFSEVHAVEIGTVNWIWRPPQVSTTDEVPAGGTLTGVW